MSEESKKTEEVKAAASENKPAERSSRPEGGNRPGGDRPQGRFQGQRVPRFRKKVCRFCHDKDAVIDYKRVDILERFVTDRGKILPRRITGTCAKHQRWLATAIKRARMIALLPFVEK